MATNAFQPAAHDEEIPFPVEYLEFFRLYAEGDYFEAHEVLEDLWVIEVEPLKTFYKGLIQAAVAICHWQRGNPSGARTLYYSASGYLAPYPAHYEGIDLDNFRRAFDRFFEPIASDGAAAPGFPDQSIPRFQAP